MIDKLPTAAPATLHVAFKNPAHGAIRPVAAVAARPDHDHVRGDHEAHRHGHRPHHGDRADRSPLYSHKGTPATSSGVFAASVYDKTESLDLKVRTAEGDVVTLSFTESNSATVSAGAVRTASGSAQAFSMESSQSSALQISVKGQLSDEELSAINALAAQVGEVADEFFDGSTELATLDAAQIDISSQAGTLSAFSFQMASRETQMAAAIYESMAQATQPPALSSAPAAEAATPSAPTLPTGDGKDFLKNLMALFDRLTGGIKDLTASPVSTAVPKTARAAEDSATAPLAAAS